MVGRHTKLTPELQQQIVVRILAGGFDHVAAESAGIDRSTFYRWMERGRTAKAGLYREFLEGVRQARAQARLTAEIEVKKIKPELWLGHVPWSGGEVVSGAA